jgi:hypothetical protein
MFADWFRFNRERAPQFAERRAMVRKSTSDLQSDAAVTRDMNQGS